jgi:ubiquinone/menaquinone biosynthesis C-methylase UbiE
VHDRTTKARTDVSDAPTRFWDIYSYTYDAVRYAIPYQRLLDALAEALALEPGMSVLDLGCATGNLEERLARTVPEASVTGVDYSASMLQRARGKCAGYAQVRFERADLAQPLPFPDDSFDRVVTNNVLYALPGREAVLAEAARVLRPGGLLVVSDPQAGASVRGLIRGHFAAVAAMPPARRVAAVAKACVTLPLLVLPPIILIVTSVAAHRKAGDYRFSTRDELADLLSGFRDVRVASAYAEQNWLAVAHVPAGSASRRASSATSSDSSLREYDITSA